MKKKPNKKVDVRKHVEKVSYDKKLKTEVTQSKKQVIYLIDENERLKKELFASLEMKKRIQPFDIKLKEASKDSEAVAFAIASDWHLEEEVVSETVNGLNKFNLDVAKTRSTQFFQNLLKLLLKEQAQARINTLVLFLGGDFISSSLHESLLEINQLRPMEAIIMAENILISGIEFLLTKSDVDLVIPCHMGNHSRLTKKVHISTENGNSMEFFMYNHMQNYFKDEPRVKFLISGSYLSYLTVFDNFTVCFQHGHAVKYQGGIGGLTIPINKAIAQWDKMRKADLYILGHWHQFFDGGNFIVNGSLIGFNSFALFIKAGFEKPKQAFFLIDKKRGKTVVAPIMFSV